jgi:4-aminobutyrate aminotransferase-like enzyme
LPDIADIGWRALVTSELEKLEHRLAGTLPSLRRSIIHNDANDYNVLVDALSDRATEFRVSGVIDFGDMIHSATIADLAVAIAYAVLDKPDPLSAASFLVRGYQSASVIAPEELSVLFDLVKLRLCLSVAVAIDQQRQRPGDEYLGISQDAIRRTLPKLIALPEDAVNTAFLPAVSREQSPRFGAPSRAPSRSHRPHIGPNLRVSYRRPLTIVRGAMQYLYDAEGRQYLDAYNNVPHVGHCHPRVVEAATRQLNLLNTNTRYLHPLLEQFAEALSATLPPPLRVCYFVNSGSEANELALRLAQAHTGRQDVIVLESAYHGITTTLIDISPYKFNGPGGAPKKPWVHVAPLPDLYRGRYREDASSAGRKYADDVGGIVEELRAAGRGVGAFIAESAPSVAGQILLPAGYLERAYAHVRNAGGVCIADEVQTAYGRIGTHFYAFEPQNVVPDIVVLGKPIGNGYPLGAVVTSEEIAATFDRGMEFFSTFGGSTVACAVGMAVLDVVRSEGLQEHARATGQRLLASLRGLQARHELIGDVRGSGFYIGVELVTDRQDRTAATAEADEIVNRLREDGILIGTDGPHHNVLKIRPPMPFDDANGDLLVAALDRALATLPASRGARRPG